MYKCVMQPCTKEFTEYNRSRIIIHFLDDHGANLQFLPDEEIKRMLVEVPS